MIDTNKYWIIVEMHLHGAGHDDSQFMQMVERRLNYLDTIIRHIIEIDKNANLIKERANERIYQAEKDTKTSIESMRKEAISEAKYRAEELYDSAVNEANDEVLKIKNMSDAECLALEENFLKIGEALEDTIFRKIFDDDMREEYE